MLVVQMDLCRLWRLISLKRWLTLVYRLEKLATSSSNAISVTNWKKLEQSVYNKRQAGSKLSSGWWRHQKLWSIQKASWLRLGKKAEGLVIVWLLMRRSSWTRLGRKCSLNKLRCRGGSTWSWKMRGRGLTSSWRRWRGGLISCMSRLRWCWTRNATLKQMPRKMPRKLTDSSSS